MGFFIGVGRVAAGHGRIVPPGQDETAAGMKNGDPQAAILS
jgi:hypothetical protein